MTTNAHAATLAERFNRSAFGHFINSRSGRIFRLLAGAAFFAAGFTDVPVPVRVGLIAWSVLPLTAGAFDVCWISAALGGPLKGVRIRAAD